jgi:cyclopropane fatty-acyl-phospholipid synthase-like methyltransferase
MLTPYSTLEEVSKQEEIPFDAIVAFDTLEHLNYESLEVVIATFASLLKMGGTFHFHNNWGQQNIYPMHFDHSDKWDRLLQKNGFSLVSTHSAIKIKAGE